MFRRTEALLLLISVIWTVQVATNAQPPCTYSNYQVLEILPTNEAQLQILKKLQMSKLIKGNEFWIAPSTPNQAVLLMHRRDLIHALKIMLESQGLQTRIAVSDVTSVLPLQTLLHKMMRQARRRKPFNESQSIESFDYAVYHPFHEITAFTRAFARANPETVKQQEIGSSYEGRPITLLTIGGNDTSEAIFLECGIHAREWISPASCLFIANELIKRASNLSDTAGLRWYILPVANPDGYVFTWTTDRFWRKTRSKPPGCEVCADDLVGGGRQNSTSADCSSCCQGADPNRNFDVHWSEVDSCSHPCCETFPGTKAFSEPETLALAQFVRAHQDRIKTYVSIHAFSQMWMFPFSYSKQRKPIRAKLFAKVGQRAIEAIKRSSNRNYVSGPSNQIMYESSGTSMDWVQNNTRVPFAFTVELRPSRYSTYELPGFCLPESQIEPTSRELLQGLDAMLLELDRADDSAAAGSAGAAGLCAHVPSVFTLMLVSASVCFVFTSRRNSRA